MLVQAIPVLHFFSEKPEVFYFAIDEEKPNEKNIELKEDKQDDKVFFFLYKIFNDQSVSSNSFQHYTSQLPSSPHLEMLTPPPDFC